MPPFYVTTPIYYVNDIPHIGHAYTTVIADGVARWHRLVGDDVRFTTGTDEHGLKVLRAAEEQGHGAREHADLTSARFRDTWDLLGITYDDFIRTSEPRHHRAVQELLQRVYDNGWIYKDTYSGLYCVACEAYYNDDDLVDGNCPIHGRPVEHLEEENWFFRLSAFEGPLTEWYEAHPDAVQPDGKRNEALGLIRHGLDDVSITRTSIDWGVPVPWDEDHVFYVWYDALINYATSVGFGVDDEQFQRWWPHVHHLLAKDILRFHCVYWPAMLLAAGLDPPHKLRVHGYLLVGGEKMSKTRLNQIFPADLVETFGVDGFRYHFLRDTPFGPDGDFSYEGMVARYNADLANQYGNLVARVSTVVAKKCDGVGPAPPRRQPARSGGGTCGRGDQRGVGRHRSQPRPRRDLVVDPGDQRVPRGARTLEDGAGPRGRRRARRRPRGGAHRHHPGQPRHPGVRRRGLAPDRAARDPYRAAAGRRDRLGRVSGGPSGREG